MQLTPRMDVVKQVVKPCETLLDVGTDHAYIPIALVKDEICRKAIAADINKGPLIRAEANIVKERYSDEIETRLGSGLSVVKQNEVQCAVIAGMGGVLISQILEEEKAVAGSIEQFVLQPMNAPEYLRQYLHENGFRINDEFFAVEGEKFYVILDVVQGQERYDDEIYYYIGKKLFERYQGKSILTDFCEKWKIEFQKKLRGQQMAVNKDHEKIEQLKQLISNLERM